MLCPAGSAGSTGIEEVNAAFLQFLRPLRRVLIMGVAAFNDNIPRRQQTGELFDYAFNNSASGNHNPDDAGVLQLNDQYFNGRGRLCTQPG
ncbi:hypothetical protein D3C80_1982500 [compost metagenome]